MARLSLLAGLLLVAVAPWSPAAEEWNQFRGPKRDNISDEKGLLKEWPKDGPPLLWNTTGLGKGYSSISIAGGKIFTMGDRPADGKEREAYVIALDLANGKELWATKIGPGFQNGRGDGPRCTPTVDGDLVYALSGSGDLICVEAANGKEKWRKSFPKDYSGRMQNNWGWSESPLVDGDQLVCTPGARDATIVALNKKTGELIWKAATPQGDPAAYCSMVVTDVAGIRQYVQLVQGGLIGVAAKDGKFLWKYRRIANGTANVPTPVVKDDLVFCSTGYQTGSALLQLVPKDGGIEAKELYFLDGGQMQNHHGGMILIGDYLYAGHGHNAGSPTCLEFKTGKIKWQKRGPGGGSAAIAYADGMLYFRYQDGNLALIEATPDDLKVKSTFKLPGSGQPSWPHPVIAGGKLYIRDQDKLLCYNVKQASS